MKNGMLALLFLSSLALIGACAHGSRRQGPGFEPQPSGAADSLRLELPKIDRRPGASIWSRGRLSSLPRYNPDSTEVGRSICDHSMCRVST
jgi:hypothetical protein